MKPALSRFLLLFLIIVSVRYGVVHRIDEAQIGLLRTVSILALGAVAGVIAFSLHRRTGRIRGVREMSYSDARACAERRCKEQH